MGNRLLVALLAALLVAAASACGGGGGGSSQGVDFYNAYRTADDQRDQAESRLRQAFADIGAAAGKEDRAGVVAAAMRGQKAASEIDDLLAAELEAAHGLAGIDELDAEGRRLAAGLEQTRDSLALVVQELEIALEDPLLARKADEVKDLAKRSTDLAVKGELAVRRADRALALALGLEPRFDQLQTTTGAGG
ncbi:MAG TPA: hypothetical protein VFW80_02225 [Gaiellaceae bacterium]|nr:hypothetical protein [Gaiellaceae bacterium]